MAASSQLRRHALPAAGNTSEQARVFLQGRIRFLTGLVGLVCFGFLIAIPAIEFIFSTGRQGFSYVASRSFLFHALATAVALGNWALLRLKQLDARALLIDDVACAVTVTTLLALMGGGIPTRYGYINALLAISFIIYMRAVVVPSSGRRTPNTVAIYDYGRTPEGTSYFAMEYLQGLGLDDLVRAIGPLPPERVVHLLHQICGSLIEAHAMGLIHRDIKPANVIVCEQGGAPDVVKVLDFGLVKDTHNRRSSGAATERQSR
jgi:hypothetical protein